MEIRSGPCCGAAGGLRLGVDPGHAEQSPTVAAPRTGGHHRPGNAKVVESGRYGVDPYSRVGDHGWPVRGRGTGRKRCGPAAPQVANLTSQNVASMVSDGVRIGCSAGLNALARRTETRAKPRRPVLLQAQGADNETRGTRPNKAGTTNPPENRPEDQDLRGGRITTLGKRIAVCGHPETPPGPPGVGRARGCGSTATIVCRVARATTLGHNSA